MEDEEIKGCFWLDENKNVISCPFFTQGYVRRAWGREWTRICMKYDDLYIPFSITLNIKYCEDE
jgi:hypothetical protein